MNSKVFRRGTVASGALVVLLASTAVSFAAIPGTDGVISACYNSSSNPSGQLRVIDVQRGDKCAKNEKALTFNQTGPQGPVGPIGPAGPQGLTGATGPTGLTGPIGPAGPTGATGPAGTQGPIGQTGPAGPQGLQGPAGPQGIQGPAGASGIATVTFAGTGKQELPEDGTIVKRVSKNLPAGNWAIVATANFSTLFYYGNDPFEGTTRCELRNGADVVGFADDRRLVQTDVHVSLSMNGGAAIPAGGGEVSLWCGSQFGGFIENAQLMIMQVDSFS